MTSEWLLVDLQGNAVIDPSCGVQMLWLSSAGKGTAGWAHFCALHGLKEFLLYMKE